MKRLAWFVYRVYFSRPMGEHATVTHVIASHAHGAIMAAVQHRAHPDHSHTDVIALEKLLPVDAIDASVRADLETARAAAEVH